MRKIVLLGQIIALFLLVSCVPTEEELREKMEMEKSKIFVVLNYPDKISPDQVFKLKISLTNELEFPVTMYTMGFPFLDFKFSEDASCTEGSVRVENDCYAAENSINLLSLDIEPMEKKVFEFDIVSDNLFGGGVISSLIRFDLKVNDPKGIRDLRKGQDIIVDLI